MSWRSPTLLVLELIVLLCLGYEVADEAAWRGRLGLVYLGSVHSVASLYGLWCVAWWSDWEAA